MGPPVDDPTPPAAESGPGAEFLDALCAGRAEDLARFRVLVVVAHPDDETIGIGAQLPKLGAATVIHVTDGAPRGLEDFRRAGYFSAQEYAATRRREVRAALALAGFDPARVKSLAVSDQEAAFHLVALTERITTEIAAWRPEIVVTHAYEGGHPDHDSTAFAVHTALHFIGRRGAAVPAVVEIASYHAGAEGQRVVAAFLPGNAAAAPVPDPCEVVLSEPERDLKRRMFDCFVSQRDVIAWFQTEVERFRAAPPYDFARPPHDGVLLYETFGWDLTGARWRELAAAARTRLDSEMP